MSNKEYYQGGIEMLESEHGRIHEELNELCGLPDPLHRQEELWARINQISDELHLLTKMKYGEDTTTHDKNNKDDKEGTAPSTSTVSDAILYLIRIALPYLIRAAILFLTIVIIDYIISIFR